MRQLRVAASHLLMLLGLAAAAVVQPQPVTVFAAPCDPPITNPVVCENSKPGNPASEWDLPTGGVGDASIQGFATDISVNKGATVQFKISTLATAYRLDIYRLGYYQGNGARKITTINPSATLPQTQPSCLSDTSTGLIDCGNWSVSASWTVPSSAVSGIYFAKVIRNDTATASHVVFIVRDDTSNSPVLFQSSDTTWQAYNTYGGNSLYSGSPAGRAYKVSYNRPFNTRQIKPQNWVFNAEYAMVRWLEANGYNVSYATDVDTDRRGAAALQTHSVFMSVGHDEYWSAGQRANVEAARAMGVHLAFFSGNESFWKTRWEGSIDGSGTPYRTLVSYKETHANAVIDPADPPTWTGTWRDKRFSPPADGGRPENALSGTLFAVSGDDYRALQVPATFAGLRFWRNTSVAQLTTGQTASLTAGCSCVLGYEWDSDIDNGSRPAGLFDMSSSTYPVSSLLQDEGSTYIAGTTTHNLTLYRASSGALVFGAGTIGWAWALDGTHDINPSSPEPAIQQATVNLLADMGVQPGNLQAGLVPATASADHTAPTSTITSPAAGAGIQAGVPVTITGTATDAGGGVVAAVEVSTDGGATWRRAYGTQSWTMSWTPTSSAQITLRSRAVDDSANLETPSAGVSVGGSQACPCTIWVPAATPTNISNSDSSSVELGVKFRSDQAGYITALRFYKGATNTGTHLGSLWSSTGALLGQAMFTSETASGWQQVNFASPIAIAANATYVASYHAPSGHYAADQNGLSVAIDRAPLHAPSSATSGGNGVYAYGSSSVYPSNTYNATNYWVDVVFNTTAAPASTPTVTPTATNTLIPANTPTPTNTPTPGPPTATPTSTPTPLPSNCPCTIWPNAATPVNAAASDSSSVEVGVKFTSDRAGYITGLRFYKGATNTGTHVGSLWSSTGTLLGQATFTSETASGWQQVNLASPVAIAANTTYVASYHAPGGHYAADQTGLNSAIDAAPLHALNSVSSGGNGVYIYAATSLFPTNTYNATNYWVDLIFNTTTAPTSTPTVTPTATNTTIPTNTPVPTNTPTPGPPTLTPTITPTPLPSNCPCTIWLNTAAPGNPSNVSDTNSVELGVKFTSDIGGHINSVRFYKGSANTGTHVVSLWTASGMLLGQATAVSETATGWQQADFTTPIAVVAGTTYVASYHAQRGGYAVDQTGLNVGVDRPPLHALSSAAAGGNGVYVYSAASAFPTNAFNSSNYWVDVVLTTP